MRSVIAAIFALFLVACVLSDAQSNERETILELASALTKLSRAVDARLYFDDPPRELRDRDLIEWATRDQPHLVEPFEGRLLRLNVVGKDSAILVCTTDGTRGLIEDAGCTAPLDANLSDRKVPQPCEFTLDLKTICATP